MDTLVKANIFFFVTTIGVVTFIILGAIAFVYLIKILRNIKRATDKLEHEIAAIGENVDSLYHKIAESFLWNMLFGKRKNK